MSGQTQLDFTAKGNGHDTAVPGNPAFDQVELRRIDGKQAEVTEKKAGAIVATVRNKLSKDGKELTVTTTAPNQPTKITVWNRTGGAKSITDPVAGEWTQDMGKSRLLQATPLRIESDGNGGVRFNWDYSYSGRFDGKPYDLKNSPNDTITLQIEDAHTVNAAARRDNQVTQQEKWIVSSDGRQMTLTSYATLENGQRVNEKLLFRKM